MPRKFLTTLMLVAGSLARRLGALPPPRRAPPRARRPLRRRRLDGVDLGRLARRRAPADARARADGPRPLGWTPGGRDPRGRAARGRLRAPLRQAQLVLPRQVPLRHPARPAAAARRGDRRGGAGARARGGPARRARARRRGARRRRLAGAGAAVRDRPQGGQGVRHGQPDRGRLRAGDCVCLVEDVVTSGGAAIEAVEALREAGLRVSNAVCVVDREEGGDALARVAVRLRPLFWLQSSGKPQQKRMVERYPIRC